MKLRNFSGLVLIAAAAMLFFTSPALANRASVSMDIPANVSQGDEITIVLHVEHNGNNPFHHTEWVYLKAGDKEIARWDFGAFSLPESEKFTREVKYTVTGPVELTAEASCNLHGSAGAVTQQVNPN